MIEILIGGDVCPRGQVGPYFSSGDTQAIFHDLLDEFERSALFIVNLECPLIEEEIPIKKSGSHLGADSSCVKGLVKAGIDVVVLANNHILDHGEAGLKNTLDVCTRAGLSTVGAGENLAAANRLLIRQVRGIRVAIYAMAEHEFSIATKDSYGANPLDLINFVRVVKAEKGNYDFLIVIVHGGNEHYVYPSPGLMNRLRFMVEAGADAVICQHTHCPGCYEEYLGSPIVYGQGNLIFEPSIKEAQPYFEGFLVRLKIADDFRSSMEIVPYCQSDSFIGARRMDANGEVEFRERITERSREIQDETIVERKWNEFCKRRMYANMGAALGYNRLFHRLNRNGTALKLLHTEQQLLRAFNLFRCETHREIIETVFSKYFEDLG